MRFLFIAAMLVSTLVFTLEGGCAARSDDTASTSVGQPQGTWNLVEPPANVPKQGLLIATGQHHGEFQPCNSNDYLTVNHSDQLLPNPAPCGSPGGVPHPHPNPHPYDVLASDAFANGTLTANTSELTKLLKSDPASAKMLVSKVNARTITSPTDLQNSAFSKLVIKKDAVTPL